MTSLLPLLCLLFWTSSPEAVSTTCRHTKNGEDYKGTLSTTYSGRTCQRWDTQSPHKHALGPSNFPGETSLTDISNYCRSPDGGTGVWCYTTDVAARWEHCVVPVCNDPCVSSPCHGGETCHATSDTTYNCLSDHCTHVDNAEDYVGTQAVGQDGQPCQRWDLYSYSVAAIGLLHYTGETPSQAENYCRNPDKGATLWCCANNAEYFQWCAPPPKCDDELSSTTSVTTTLAITTKTTSTATFRKVPGGVAVDPMSHPSSKQIVRSRTECARKCEKDDQCVHFIMSEDREIYLCETYSSLFRPPTETPPTDNYKRIAV